MATDGVPGARDLASTIASTVTALPQLHSVRHELNARELAGVTRDALAILQLAESAVVGLVTEAIQRGVIQESSAAGAAQWVARLAAGESPTDLLADDRFASSGPLVPVDAGATTESQAPPGPTPADEAVRPQVPGLEPARVTQISTVATACAKRQNAVLDSAVAGGRIGVPAAKIALTEVEKVMAVLPEQTRDDVFGHFLALPAGSGSRAVRELTRRVIATFADESYLDDLDARLDRTESVTWTELPTGMVELVAQLAPVHAARVQHAIQALSAPAPGNTCCDDAFHRHTGDPTHEADDRSPAKRRADALMLLVERGAGAIDHDSDVTTSGQAKIVVTIDFDTLAGRLRGHGRTEAGASLTPQNIRQVACDAEILPMVLGSESEPLDVGRRKRLVTGSLRAAVVERDRQCTFDGCDRPPSWCQVHHVIPWWTGGPTSLDNSALLCQRHHTIVHRDGLTATVDPSGVTWDLTPGRMPTTARPAA